MIKQWLNKIITQISYKLSSMGYSELIRLRLKGVAKPSYVGRMYMSNEEYIDHIKSLPPRLALITTAFFITKKVQSRLQHG